MPSYPEIAVLRGVPMRGLYLILCLMISLGQSGLANGQNPADTFNVTSYKLAFAHVDEQGQAINEYIPRGESLKDWSSMIAIRQWPKVNHVDALVAGYLRHIDSVKVEEPSFYAPKKGKENTEAIIESFLAPPDKSYLEHNLVRFVLDRRTGIAKSYQLSYRGPYNLANAKSSSSRLLEARLEVIRGLSLDVYADTNSAEDHESDDGSMDEDSEEDDSEEEDSEEDQDSEDEAEEDAGDE